MMMGLVVAFSFALSGLRQIGKWWNIAFLVAVVVLHYLNQRYRDKAWRRLIELEAPELHRKINGNGA
jgi:hypothetical protein